MVADRPGIGAIDRERRWEYKAPSSPPEQKIGHQELCFGTRPCLVSEPEQAMSDAGAASWYDVAVAGGERGVELGLLEQMAQVNPITMADYPTPAQRPSYSLLDCLGSRKALDLPVLHWRQALRQLLEAVAGPNRETAGPPLGC